MHLQHNIDPQLGITIRSFTSVDSTLFQSYLQENSIYFVMCHDGADDTSTSTISISTKSRMKVRTMIYWFMSNQYNVALMNETEFMDAKVLTLILEHSKRSDMTIRNGTCHQSSNSVLDQGDVELILSKPADITKIQSQSQRIVVTCLALQLLLQSTKITKREARLFLLHTALLQSLPLHQRVSLENLRQVDCKNIILDFSNVALRLLEENSDSICNLRSKDLADLIDGRLLALPLTQEGFVTMLLSSSILRTQFSDLLSKFSQYYGQDIGDQQDCIVLGVSETVDRRISRNSGPALLPFNDVVSEKHLRPIKLVIEEKASSIVQDHYNKIFREVSHWHNHKRKFKLGHRLNLENWWTRRRNQWFMAEMQSYAASLTNAVGNILIPEIIVTNQKGVGQPLTFHSKSNNQRTSAAEKTSRKVGRVAALEASAELQARKADSKYKSTVSMWSAKAKEIRLHPDLQVQFVLANNVLAGLSTDHALKPEIELFSIDCLLRALVGYKDITLFVVNTTRALIWDVLLRITRDGVGITLEIRQALSTIVNTMSFLKNIMVDATISRPLAFECFLSKLANVRDTISAINSGPSSEFSHFQLEFCGPYMERPIGLIDDSRVPFRPDAWQRNVLDAIDQNHSLFVVAPTSAGKTFISFYAMKKVLQASDDDVVVYVAPTKALVNQIAAEIQARFSKSYKQDGRSVWGIHTRDYRINNPTGCQILVTVPHLLQIMLLALVNADKPKSWSCRIKRIIFGEIHCIGQAEDGLIWEQLLLQAPCPVIALSATVGNPEEFSDWLGSTQRANGHKLVTIQHEHRYSDLRKYVYRPPVQFCFSGLPKPRSLIGPGLEETDAFAFVHPVASLTSRARTMPKDLALEARDCFILWKTMVKLQTQKYPMPSHLNPGVFLPPVIKKVDISNWVIKLKLVLQEWRTSQEFPFDKIVASLGMNLFDSAQRPILTTNSSDQQHWQPRKVQDKLTSTILPILVDLHVQNALPCIVFNYDRGMCEKIAKSVLLELKSQDDHWKQHDTSRQRKVAHYESWLKDQELSQKIEARKSTKAISHKNQNMKDDDKLSNLEQERDRSNMEWSKFQAFDPTAPLAAFSFANDKHCGSFELRKLQGQLRAQGVSEWLVKGLERGIGVHHAGMNRKYRQVTEMLFRSGHLRIVVATGTLALGINMPCKTVIFAGDSVFLTALNFRQGAGRAGPRGFDLLGNVVFLHIPISKIFRLISSKLPDLKGHFPITTSLVLRLATLLHDPKSSKFAVSTIDSILSQPRLSLGSKDMKSAVLHHLRFSMEYLLRQSLLAANGAPLNFTGCVSHLYYTENAAWAFHALLSRGYFHELCQDFNHSPQRVCLELMLVIAHIFGRLTCRRSDQEFIEEVVRRSSSLVFLPPLPEQAHIILKAHNQEVLEIYQAYVKTYVEQHLPTADDRLPLTNLQFGGDIVMDSLPLHESPNTIRFPFVALSGHQDIFVSISDLCETVRSGVFLEKTVVPYLQLHPEESSTPLNAYLYDFYNHGDIKSLETGNGLPSSNVWFKLNDFSMIIATIDTSLKNFMISTPIDNDPFEIMGSGDVHAEEMESRAIALEEDRSGRREASLSAANPINMVDTPDSPVAQEELGLVNVLKAFTMLQTEFNDKFRKTWS